MSVSVIMREYHSELVIECPARCVDTGCETHKGQTWRESATLPQGTSIDYARVLLERHEEEFPKSGPYRLVEYVTESKKTMEVIEP